MIGNAVLFSFSNFKEMKGNFKASQQKQFCGRHIYKKHLPLFE